MIYQQAQEIALRILKELEPYCNAIDFAGAVARQEKEVESIVIFCLPKRNEKSFVFVEFMKKVNSFGFFVSGHLSSGYAKYHLFEAINLEIIMPTEKDYFYKLATYDAPKEFVDRIDAMKNKKGLPFPCETEWQFFNHLGMDWKPVKDRY